MKTKTKGGLLVGAGFLLGTVGVKALTSSTAKKAYVQGVAKGIQAKNCYENIVEQAKAQVDDIVAEAQYISVASVTTLRKRRWLPRTARRRHRLNLPRRSNACITR